MKIQGLFLCCVFLIAIASCGGGSNNPMMNPPPAFPPLNGNLAFAANSQVTNTNTFNVSGQLMVDSMGKVSGNLAIASVSATVPGACFPAGTMIAFTGTLTTQGGLALTSAASNGQIVSLAVTVGSDGNAFSNGSFTVTGGCLGGDHGTLTVNHLVAGAYTGAVTLNGNMVNVTVNFGQVGIPQLDGSIPVGATATFANNSACGFSSAASEVGEQSGQAVHLDMPAMNSPSLVSFGGSITDSSATMISGALGVTGGTCDQMKGSIILKKS